MTGKWRIGKLVGVTAVWNTIPEYAPKDPGKPRNPSVKQQVFEPQSVCLPLFKR